jgi:membrane protease YdiL (CAAX protease family)
MYNKSSSGIVEGQASDANTVFAVLPLRYLMVAFSFSWTFWFFPLATGQGWISWPWLVSAKIPLILVGSFGPFFSAFTLCFLSGGTRATLQFAKRALRFRIPVGILLLALLLFPGLAALAIYLHMLNGGATLMPLLSMSQIPLTFLIMFFIGGAFQEEFGWAFAIDHMQRNWDALPAAILLGIIWAIWHLPLFFIPGLTQTYMPFWSFLLTTTCFRILFVWAYDATNHSILTPLLFHTSLNFTLNLFPLIDRHDGAVQKDWLYFCLLSGIAALPVIWYLWRGKGRHLAL